MKILINNTFKQPALMAQSCSSNNDELKELFESMVSPKLSNNPKWIKDNEVLLNESPSLEIHSFLLKAEKLGKKIEYTKQTIINIID